jgi:4-cresol dehydrogenase (hydroxylating)
MGNRQVAILSWTAALGEENVITRSCHLRAAATATFEHDVRVVAILTPECKEQVIACIKICNDYKIPFYPISTGKNWGLGSAAPVETDNAILHLGKLKTIVEYDEELAFVRIQPGVTFNQLYEFLRNNNSNLIMDVTGADGDTSVIGNALERGHGLGLLADRASNVLDFEVVLCDGTVIHTGYSRFGHRPVSNLSRWCVGPEIQNLFSQSSLGVVVELTMWLQPKPKHILSFFVGCNTTRSLSQTTCSLNAVKMAGSQVSYRFFNRHRLMALMGSSSTTADSQPNREAEGDSRSPIGWAHDWNGIGAVFAQTPAELAAAKELVTSTIGPSADLLAYFGIEKEPREEIVVGRPSTEPLFDRGLLNSIYQSFLGTPISSQTMCYWKKPIPVADRNTPELDNCGLIWICPRIPCKRIDLERFLELVEKICSDFGFEPNIGLLFPTPRAVDATVALLYDRSLGQDGIATECHRALMGALFRHGCLPYRLSVQSMQWLPTSDADEVLKKIKQLLDPNRLISPGRYI